MTCLMGIGLYVFDLTTDITFSFDMLYGNMETQNYSHDFKSFSIFNDKFPSCPQACWEEQKAALDIDNTNKRSLEAVKEDYQLTGWFAVWHCIQPFVVILIVFLSMNYKKWFRGNKCSAPGDDMWWDDGCCAWWCYNTVCCCLPNVTYIGSFLPIPVFTNLYRFFLDYKFHYARSKSDFKTGIDYIEEKIKEHEDIGKF